MDPLVTGSLISAGGNLLGGIVGRDRQPQWTGTDAWLYRDQRRLMLQAEKRAAQREATALSTRVADARRAGIHPLAALGAQINTMGSSLGGMSYPTPHGSTSDGRGDAIRMATAQVGQMVADKEESLSRTRLNNAQAAMLEADAKLKAPGAPPHPELLDHDIKKPQFTPTQNFFGMKLRHSPWFSDGQTREDRWGDSEIRETLLQVPQILSDIIYSIGIGTGESAAKGAGGRGYTSDDPVFTTFE